MMSKPVAVGILAAACISAAAGGAYFAGRQNASPDGEQAAVEAGAPTGRTVAETEAVVASPAAAVEAVTPARTRTTPSRATAATAERPPAPRKEPVRTEARTESPAAPPRTAPTPPEPAAVERPSPREPEPATVPPVPPTPVEPVVPEPVVPARPALVEVVVPSSSVVGLNVQTPLSSETARVEDRVEARVTRDVMADGRVAIPAGTRVIGDVTLVERGGKMKDKARLGIRFHTMVLADNTQIPFRTDAIYREGSSPGAEASRKIGGAAVGGAILGAILGGAKGAAIGGATGAAGGSAVVMAGDRNAATLPAGTIVTVRLTAPVTVDVEREQ
jgi:hypothetical protein